MARTVRLALLPPTTESPRANDHHAQRDHDVEGTAMVKRLYVGFIHAIRIPATHLGLLEWLEHSRFRWLRHVRTLFAFYDMDDLLRLRLPWWTYRAIDEVDKFLAKRPNARVFEFGAGASTLWLAERASEVHSVEHDVSYGRALRPLVEPAPNVDLHLVPPAPATEGNGPIARSGRRGYEGLDFSDYLSTIDRVGGPFDLIVIDGRARVDALHRASDHLAPDGLILFDDIRRRRYRPAREARDWEVALLAGAKPSIPYRDATALLRRRPAR